jgi:hypothetical protein
LQNLRATPLVTTSDGIQNLDLERLNTRNLKTVAPFCNS